MGDGGDHRSEIQELLPSRSRADRGSATLHGSHTPYEVTLRKRTERILGPELGDMVRAIHEQHGVVFQMLSRFSGANTTM